MSNKSDTKVTSADKIRTKPKWVFRRVSTALSEAQSTMLDELVRTASLTNPMASMTTVMQDALIYYYNSKQS